MKNDTVYYFKKNDITIGEALKSARPATREAIKGINGAVILEETAQEVEADKIDGNGFLIVAQ